MFGSLVRLSLSYNITYKEYDDSWMFGSNIIEMLPTTFPILSIHLVLLGVFFNSVYFIYTRYTTEKHFQSLCNIVNVLFEERMFLCKDEFI